MSPVFKRVVRKIRRFSIKRKIKKSIGNSPINLEIGAGDRKGKIGWITIDIDENADISWDLKFGIPLNNNSVKKIYSSHFMEHLTYKEGQVLLDECLRVLVSGGVFSVCVPNSKIYIEAYANDHVLDDKQFFRYEKGFNNTTKIDYVNYCAYMGGAHKYMFDQENLLFILINKGFENVRPRSFDPSMDRKDRDFESIYAEATKP